jgi:hypothetical protein
MDCRDGNLYVADKTKVSACDNNLWYQSAGGTEIYTSIDATAYHYDDQAAYQSATGWDTNGKWEDPLFVSTSTSDFHLKPSSPAIDAGVGVSLTSDYSGAKVPQRTNPSIGAYEFVRRRLGNKIMPGVVVTAPTGDSCTGNLLLSWHGEDAVVTSGSPAGCVIAGGDDTATLGGGDISAAQYHDGANSFHWAASTNADFTVSSNDIVTQTAGTVDFWIYLPTLSDLRILRAASATQSIFIEIVGTEAKIRCVASGDNSATTSGATIAATTWTHIIGKWQTTGTPNLYIEANGVSATEGSDFTWDANNFTSLWLGDYLDYAVQGYMDELKIYNNYQ